MRKIVGYFLLANMLCHVPYNAGRTWVQIVMLDGGYSPEQVGVASALFALPALLLSAFIGRLIDQRGARNMLVAGPALALLGALMLYGYGMVAFCSSAIFIGIGFAVWSLSVNATVGVVSPPSQRTRNFGLMAFSYSISSLVSSTLIGALAERHVLLYGPYLLCASAIGALVVNHIAQRGAYTKQKLATNARDIVSIRFTPQIKLLLAISGFCAVMWDLALFLLPLKASANTDLRANLALMYACFTGATACGRLAIGLSAQSDFSRRLLPLLIAMTGIGGVLLMHFDTRHGLIAALLLIGLGTGGMFPLILSLLHDYAEKGSEGRLVGLTVTLLGFSAVLVPYIVGLFFSQTVPPAFGVAVGAVGLGLIVMSGFALKRTA